MILSMTGFGRSIVEYNHNKIIAEVKSLNSKQFDLLMRVPGYYRELEPELRSVLAEHLQRGKVDLTITLENLGEASVVLNVEAMEHYKRQIEDMCTRLNIAWPTDWVGQLMRMPDAMKSEVRLLSDSERNIVKGAVVKAAHALTDFRRTEGAKLEVFFADKIRRIGELLSEVEPFENSRVAKLRERLEAQLQKLQGVEIDAGRLEQELIYYIEKLDVTEEKTRLRAHLNYFTETMAGEPGQGKKLGFIAQEMGREINTLGSKSNNAEMQRIVVKMKDELEQIKEQVLNVL
ncbi:MAG: YicC family protein [Porphyromonadaceae bacterium]|nr:YicC family protein [Porphyromonadaceae bacterium]MDD6313418.1 YicC family protein [Porphyromonadaceae bacterium]